MAAVMSVFLTLILTTSTHSSDLTTVYSNGARKVLALKTDPLKPRLDQIRKQVDDHKSLALAYASYARKLKLENSKLVRVFVSLSRNYTDLISSPTYRSLFESTDSSTLDEAVLRRFEKEVKERIKVARQNENRTLWKLGTLPPGLITYYSTTKPLDKSWHVLGLGYNPSISMEEIRNAAVVHFNGNMKPWVDIGLNQFKSLWTQYVDYENEHIQSCNFGL